MGIVWKKEEITRRLTDIVDHIVAVALKDDVITTDEQELLDVIRQHLLSFESTFEALIEEHRDVEQVMSKTRALFEQAIATAAQQARKDGTITSDELILIDRMAKSLRNEDLSRYFS